MRFGIAALAFLLTSLTFAQETLETAGKVTIEGKIEGAENKKIQLINKNLGGVKSPIAETTADAEGKYRIETPIAFPDYYIFRTETGQMISLILRNDDKVTVNGDNKDLFHSATIIGSPNSVLMNEFLDKYSVFKRTEDSLKNVLRMDQTKQAEINAFFSPKAQAFYAYRNKFINQNQGSPALLAVLNAVDEEREWTSYKQIVGMLRFSFAESPTIKGLIDYTNQKDVKMEKMAEFNANKAKLFSKGVLVKDIVLPDTSGFTRKLSDLKGKVVLIDFWASWCKPCRRENPNVVKAYEKYNQDGFEVFSVSLDKPGAKERWKAAIKQDGLVWANHVSDLKGFNSQAAADYMINSIPFTVLIDTEGKVIATNLRGEKLQEALKEIFGH